MAIIDTLTQDQFCRMLKQDWKDRYGRYSWEALRLFYDYLDELSESCGEPLEFDPIAFDCEYTICDGVSDLQEWVEDQGENFEELMDGAEDVCVQEIVASLPRSLDGCVCLVDGDVVIIRNC